MGDIGSISCVSDLQNGWVTLGPFKVIWCSLPKNNDIFLAKWYEFTLHSCLNDLSIKAYSLLQWYVSIAVVQQPYFIRAIEGSLKRKKFKSKVVLVFYKMDG